MLFNTALKMWGMAFQTHNHVKQSEGGMPTDLENVKHYTFRIIFPISVERGFFTFALHPAKV